MKLVVGLGNPGEQYKQTRHNMGFLFLDHFVSTYVETAEWKYEKKYNADLVVYAMPQTQEKVLFVKPHTYMNDSGKCVLSLMQFYKVTASNVIVVHDDVDILLGSFQLKYTGSSAGHNGVESVIQEIGTDAFWRIRLGIGRPHNEKQPVESYVLEEFYAQEKEVLPELFLQVSTILKEELLGGENMEQKRYTKTYGVSKRDS